MSKGISLRVGRPLVVELVPAGHLGRPLVLPISQLVVRMPNGTPVVVAAEFGPDHSYAVSRAGDEDFDRVLRNLQLDITSVQVDTVLTPAPPPGARLVAAPNLGE